MSFSEKPIRYLGFGAAIGESISPLVDGDIVRACYTVGALFIVAHVLVDIMDTGNIVKVLDTLIFEMIASALLPTFLAINLMQLVDNLLSRWNAGSEIRDYLPTILTLLVIIVTTDPRDSLVNKLLDLTFRKVFK